MAESDLTLIGAWQSPFVLRARVALNIKNLQYVFHEETFGNKSELLLKSNPVHKKIPVLLHSGKSICESLIIVEYIDEVWSSSGHAILPSDPYDRAIARFWASYIDEKFFPSLRSIAVLQDEAGKKAAVEQVVTGISLLEKAFGESSKGKPFFGGDHVGYLDIAFGGMLSWIKVTEIIAGLKLIDPETTPQLAQWAENFIHDPAVSGVFPDIGTLTEYSKVVIAKLRGSAGAK